MPRPHACGASSGEACLAPTQMRAHVTDPLRWALIRSPGRRTPFQRRGRAAARRETRGKISARRAVTSQPFRLNDLVNLGNLHKLRPFSRFRFPVPRSRFSPLPVWSSLALFSACETFHERKCFCKSATYVKKALIKIDLKGCKKRQNRSKTCKKHQKRAHFVLPILTF